jgi:hypothetical protein
MPGFITPGELLSFLDVALPQATLFPLVVSYLSVCKLFELSQFITRLGKSKLTPWCLPPPRVHVLLCGPLKILATTIKDHYQAFVWVLIDLIVELVDLIIKPFDNQTEN